MLIRRLYDNAVLLRQTGSVNKLRIQVYMQIAVVLYFFRISSTFCDFCAPAGTPVRGVKNTHCSDFRTYLVLPMF